jgi:NAD(P)-dependent dehydrogenase (short-subunit alcohol dehydrogenase family)
MTGTVLITGAGRRLGAHIARALAGAGYFVVLHYNGSKDGAEAVAADIAAAGGACGMIGADLSDRGAIARLIPESIQRFGPIRSLVNNASTYHFDTIATLETAAWDANLRVNLEAPVFLAKALHAALAGAPGAIVNILDFKVANLNPDYLSYTLAKSAMAAFTRVAAMAFAGTTRVNAVAPGLTLRSGKQTDAQFERAWRMTPLGRGPLAEEIASAVVFALGMGALNGQILYLDGGASLRPRERDISVDPAALKDVLF